MLYVPPDMSSDAQSLPAASYVSDMPWHADTDQNTAAADPSNPRIRSAQRELVARGSDTYPPPTRTRTSDSPPISPDIMAHLRKNERKHADLPKATRDEVYQHVANV